MNKTVAKHYVKESENKFLDLSLYPDLQQKFTG